MSNAVMIDEIDDLLANMIEYMKQLNRYLANASDLPFNEVDTALAMAEDLEQQLGAMARMVEGAAFERDYDASELQRMNDD